MDPATHFDHVIIGSGQALGTLIGGLPEGETVAVIEGGLVGGTCVNVGCTPTKTLVASAKVAHMARRASEYGVTTGPVGIDFARVMERMDVPRVKATTSMEAWLSGLDHVTLYRDWARFVAAKTVQVGDTTVSGERVYINVGARPRVPDLAGLEDVPWLDNARLLDLRTLPEHLVIIGGSYIGLEFAQMFRRFGARVTVLEAGDQIAPREDVDVANALRGILEEEGIVIRTGARVERVEATSEGGVRVLMDDGDVTGSHLLVAVGREPNSDRLNLPAAGIETDARGFIEVDDHLMTSAPDVFALGDVNGQGAFTHTSVNDAEIVLDTLRGGSRRLSDRIPVFALFTDPPLGRVGLSEREAIDQGHRVLKATRSMDRIARAKEMGETKGFVKLLVDADTDLILGAAILGVSGDEVINMFAAFMYSGRPCREYRRAVLVHPTISELMPWILDDLAPIESAPVPSQAA